jgi:hypothetical protein
MKLEECHEIIGILNSVKKKRHLYKLIFTFSKEIEIASNVFSQKKLESYIGKKIGILHFNNSYKLRLIKDQKISQKI